MFVAEQKLVDCGFSFTPLLLVNFFCSKQIMVRRDQPIRRSAFPGQQQRIAAPRLILSAT
ncbi:MAG: hypothetical protein NTV22_17560 [bacterium]|nr:hypothetical protein [bacterium]